MGRQFPHAGGTGPIVRRADGCGVPRPRISALRFPLLGLRRVRNRQFGTTARRDAPRGNAPARLSKIHGENHDAKICAHNSPPSCPRTAVRRTASLRSPMSRASTPWRQSKAWMAGTSPAMTNVGSAQAARLLRGACHRAGQRPDPLARNDVDGSSDAVIARSAQRDEANLRYARGPLRFGETNPSGWIRRV